MREAANFKIEESYATKKERLGARNLQLHMMTMKKAANSSKKSTDKKRPAGVAQAKQYYAGPKTMRQAASLIKELEKKNKRSSNKSDRKKQRNE